VTLRTRVTREGEEKGDGPTVGQQASCREFTMLGLTWSMAPGCERWSTEVLSNRRAGLSLAEGTP
jgi:hypothetical protein